MTMTLANDVGPDSSDVSAPWIIDFVCRSYEAAVEHRRSTPQGWLNALHARAADHGAGFTVTRAAPEMGILWSAGISVPGSDVTTSAIGRLRARLRTAPRAGAQDAVWAEGANSHDGCCVAAPMVCPLRGSLWFVMAWHRPPGEGREIVGVRHWLGVLATRLAGIFSQGVLPLDATRSTLLASLSETRRRLLPMLLEGLTEQEIAGVCHRSPHTVHDHVKAIYRTLGVSSRESLATLWETGHRDQQDQVSLSA